MALFQDRAGPADVGGLEKPVQVHRSVAGTVETVVDRESGRELLKAARTSGAERSGSDREGRSLTLEKCPNVHSQNFGKGKRWRNAARGEFSTAEPSPRTLPRSAA